MHELIGGRHSVDVVLHAVTVAEVERLGVSGSTVDRHPLPGIRSESVLNPFWLLSLLPASSEAPILLSQSARSPFGVRSRSISLAAGYYRVDTYVTYRPVRHHEFRTDTNRLHRSDRVENRVRSTIVVSHAGDLESSGSALQGFDVRDHGPHNERASRTAVIGATADSRTAETPRDEVRGNPHRLEQNNPIQGKARIDRSRAKNQNQDS